MKTRAFTFTMFAAIATAFGARPAMAGLSAGAAKVEITPNLKEFPTTSLGGFGDRGGKPAQGVHDGLYAHALVLANGGAKVALVSCDLLKITPGMKQAVLKQVAGLGFTEDNLLLAATHTHSGPEGLHPEGDVWPQFYGRFQPGLYAWITARVAEAIGRANGSLQPAQVGFAAAAIEGMSHNRRKTGGGLLDVTMTVMNVVGPDAKPIALVVNFAAHPTIMGADSFLFSAEWPGAMCKALEERMGRGVALFFNGDEGDQTHSGDFGSGWERVGRYGGALAEKAWQLAQEAKMSGDVVLRARAVAWRLPGQRLSPTYAEKAGEEYGKDPERVQRVLRALFPGELRLQAVRVGDAVLMPVPGEEITELGLAMKANASAAGARYPMVIGLANNQLGYILSPKQYDAGGYEPGMSFYGRELGDIIVAEMKQAVGPLFAAH